MKKTITYKVQDKRVEKEVIHIPVRYIIAVTLAVLEILAILGIVVFLSTKVYIFGIVSFVLRIYCILKIVASDDNPDYKVPWLFFVLILPIAGFMLYFMFYSRKLKKKYVKKLKKIKEQSYVFDDTENFEKLEKTSKKAYSQAKMLTNISESHLFCDTKQTYFASGEQMLPHLLSDIEKAKEFIYIEYFIIEYGYFWSEIFSRLCERAKNGVDVKIVYDDIGCMTTLPGNFFRLMKKHNITAVPFSILRGNADSEFNNRSHRKLFIIDGKCAYTGGINIADEYINRKKRFGYWKDTAIKLEGNAVWEMTKLFLIDYGINVRRMPDIKKEHFPLCDINERGYLIPFGDGPKPLFARNVGKSVIQNMLYSAEKYVYMTTPYLIIDNDLCTDIENTALRGVDVRIVVPHIPDKKTVFEMTKSYYKRLMDAGVKIYEYTPGFIHAKNYIADGEIAMTGTINLDYRSLVHHFENGVWMYNCECIKDIEADILKTLDESRLLTKERLSVGLFKRFYRAVIKIFAPML